MKKSAAFVCASFIAAGIFSDMMPLYDSINAAQDLTDNNSFSLRGDANLDGAVTQLDATVILQEILAGDMRRAAGTENDGQMFSEYDEESARLMRENSDADRSGTVDQSDANMILRAVLYADAAGQQEMTEPIWMDAAGTAGNGAALWIGVFKRAEDGSMPAKGLTDDCDIFSVTFRIKEDAEDGIYHFFFISNDQYSASFADKDLTDYQPVYCDGVIGINTEVPETEHGNEFSLVAESLSAVQGEYITVTCSLKNIPDEILAFNTYFKYDRSAMEMISINVSDDIKHFGAFESSIPK